GRVSRLGASPRDGGFIRALRDRPWWNYARVIHGSPAGKAPGGQSPLPEPHATATVIVIPRTYVREERRNGPLVVSAHDVARELRQRLPHAGDVKIHKLLYYCQGWHLARYGDPLFNEPVEAWANGPVVADLWRDEKYHQPAPAPQGLDDAMHKTL